MKSAQLEVGNIGSASIVLKVPKGPKTLPSSILVDENDMAILGDLLKEAKVARTLDVEASAAVGARGASDILSQQG